MKQLEQICRDLTAEAVEILAETMRDPSVSRRERVAAALAVLDRGHGKPVDRQVQLQLGTGAGGEVEDLTDAQLLRIAAGALGGGSGNAQVIDLKAISRPTPPSDLKRDE